jgi:hypothetical protein
VPGIEVDPGPGQQGLAGIEGLAAREHRGDPLLGAQLGLAAGAAPAGATRLQLARLQPLTLGDLLAAAVADPYRDGRLEVDFVQVGPAGGRPLGT